MIQGFSDSFIKSFVATYRFNDLPCRKNPTTKAQMMWNIVQQAIISVVKFD